MELLLNWVIALCVVLLLFAGLYVIVKMAVRSAIKEALWELGKDVARKVWEEDDDDQSPRS